MSAFDVVEMFEARLAEYTGAPYAVAVDSCTNALFLSLLWYKQRAAYEDLDHMPPGPPITVKLPKHTYLGVAQSAINAGYSVEWEDREWKLWYDLQPLNVWDSAKFLERDMYAVLLSPHNGIEAHPLVCLSFHIAKKLPLGRGGAILCDTTAQYNWLKRARFDGRSAGQTGTNATMVTMPGYHMYLTPPEAARAMWLLDVIEGTPEQDSWLAYPDISTLFDQ